MSLAYANGVVNQSTETITGSRTGSGDMSDNVVYINPRQDEGPCVNIRTPKAVHVVPLSFFHDVIEGQTSFSVLDDGEEILREILSDWLKLLEGRS